MCEEECNRPPPHRSQSSEGRRTPQYTLSQHLATCRHPDYASLQIVRANSEPRKMKHTLQTAYMERMEYVLEDGCIPDIKLARKDVHIRAVRTAITRRDPNEVLGTTPPKINEDEVALTKCERTTPAQIRPDFCSVLKDFQNRIGLSASPLSPCCRQAEYTAQHIFQCPEHPTTTAPLNM